MLGQLPVPLLLLLRQLPLAALLDCIPDGFAQSGKEAPKRCDGAMEQLRPERRRGCVSAADVEPARRSPWRRSNRARLRARQAAYRLALGRGYPDSGLVLVDPLGAPIQPEAYSDRFRVLCREAELRKIDLHYVRHTLAGIMHRAGVAPADAAVLLGHTLAFHLSTYVPSTERGARTAASGLGIALTGAV